MIKEKTIWQTGEFDKPLVTAAYFGFQPIETPRITKNDIEATRDNPHHPHFDITERAALIRTYLERNFGSLPHPISISYKRDPLGRGRSGYSLHFIGSPSGLVDAALIRCALSMLSDLGKKNVHLEINSVGDRDSMNAHERELHALVRKLGQELPESIRTAIEQNVFEIFNIDTPEAREIRSRIPSSISFLTPQSRNYFKEVLEYVEMLGIEFELNPDLVGERSHASNTIFVIKDAVEKGEILATGYHYPRLGRRLGFKRELPIAGVSIFLPKAKMPAGEMGMKIRVYKDLPNSKFYLVQLGREARMKTLPLLETLRQEHIRVHHLLGRDKITVQLSVADTLPITHLIIVGQKEALENTATVRNISTRAQVTISLQDLPHCLKCLPI